MGTPFVVIYYSILCLVVKFAIFTSNLIQLV
nr:MAG TPA: hypothetical protein [Caudoviricetes sp.]DAQ08940.1 MAG TPA: hypothetical protein [Caudoviricetes sp.]DAR28524.1 MAG TPA: hypothetical protein [Caudoviricetes sp.]DAU55663.1 MAG TPA: hypothetical protein [Caudoviricetes sp.]